MCGPHSQAVCCRQAVEEGGSGAACHGPVTQAHFLCSLGIDARLEALQAAATLADVAQLRAGYERYAGQCRVSLSADMLRELVIHVVLSM